MGLLVGRCAGVGIGKAEVVACVRHLLANDTDHDDLGGDYFTRRGNPDRRRDHPIEQPHTLGYRVTLDKVA